MKENPFVFAAADIRQKGKIEVSPEITAEDFADAFPGRDVIRKISADICLQMAGEDIVLTGNVKAELVFECSRCGEPAVKVFSDSFDEYYPNSVEYINVRENIRETVSLMEPMKVLCSENCKGRCPQCGADLNKKQCSCVQEKASPFAALKNFRPKN